MSGPSHEAFPVITPGAAVVLRPPQVLRVPAASPAGRLPLGSAPLALLLVARETMGIPMAGMLVGAYTARKAIGQPLLARMADRWRQPLVMWAAAAMSTTEFVAAVTLPGPVPVTAAAALAGFGAPPFEACLPAWLWKDLISERAAGRGVHLGRHHPRTDLHGRAARDGRRSRHHRTKGRTGRRCSHADWRHPGVYRRTSRTPMAENRRRQGRGAHHA
jgi:hypothetical protein